MYLYNSNYNAQQREPAVLRMTFPRAPHGGCSSSVYSARVASQACRDAALSQSSQRPCLQRDLINSIDVANDSARDSAKLCGVPRSVSSTSDETITSAMSPAYGVTTPAATVLEEVKCRNSSFAAHLEHVAAQASAPTSISIPSLHNSNSGSPIRRTMENSEVVAMHRSVCAPLVQSNVSSARVSLSSHSVTAGAGSLGSAAANSVSASASLSASLSPSSPRLCFMKPTLSARHIHLCALTHWVPEAHVYCCMAPDCGAAFSFFARKYRCKMCGRIYCSACCANSVTVPVYSSACAESTNAISNTTDTTATTSISGCKNASSNHPLRVDGATYYYSYSARSADANGSKYGADADNTSINTKPKMFQAGCITYPAASLPDNRDQSAVQEATFTALSSSSSLSVLGNHSSDTLSASLVHAALPDVSSGNAIINSARADAAFQDPAPPCSNSSLSPAPSNSPFSCVNNNYGSTSTIASDSSNTHHSKVSCSSWLPETVSPRSANMTCVRFSDSSYRASDAAMKTSAADASRDVLCDESRDSNSVSGSGSHIRLQSPTHVPLVTAHDEEGAGGCMACYQAATLVCVPSHDPTVVSAALVSTDAAAEMMPSAQGNATEELGEVSRLGCFYIDDGHGAYSGSAHSNTTTNNAAHDDHINVNKSVFGNNSSVNDNGESSNNYCGNNYDNYSDTNGHGAQTALKSDDTAGSDRADVVSLTDNTTTSCVGNLCHPCTPSSTAVTNSDHTNNNYIERDAQSNAATPSASLAKSMHEGNPSREVSHSSPNAWSVIRVCNACYHETQLAICSRQRGGERRGKSRGEFKMFQRALMVHILSYLTLSDLSSVSLVSSDFYFMSRDNLIWYQYNMRRLAMEATQPFVPLLTARGALTNGSNGYQQQQQHAPRAYSHDALPIRASSNNNNNNITDTNSNNMHARISSSGPLGDSKNDDTSNANKTSNTFLDCSSNVHDSASRAVGSDSHEEFTRRGGNVGGGIAVDVPDAMALTEGEAVKRVISLHARYNYTHFLDFTRRREMARCNGVTAFMAGARLLFSNTIRIAVIGPCGVGKTNCVRAFLGECVITPTSNISAAGGGDGSSSGGNNMDRNHHNRSDNASEELCTMGFMQRHTTVKLTGAVRSEVAVVVYDISGSPRYEQLRRLICRHCHAIALCYDPAQKHTLVQAADVMMGVEDVLGPQPVVVCGLVQSPTGGRQATSESHHSRSNSYCNSRLSNPINSTASSSVMLFPRLMSARIRVDSAELSTMPHDRQSAASAIETDRLGRWTEDGVQKPVLLDVTAAEAVDITVRSAGSLICSVYMPLPLFNQIFQSMLDLIALATMSTPCRMVDSMHDVDGRCKTTTHAAGVLMSPSSGATSQQACSGGDPNKHVDGIERMGNKAQTSNTADARFQASKLQHHNLRKSVAVAEQLLNITTQPSPLGILLGNS